MVTRSILRPVLRPVTRAVSDTIRGFNPRSLFASGEQGAWYDPSDFSTLYQDSAGTTPVTAVGQPVGLMLDKRLGLELGAERWADGSASFIGESSRVSPNVYRIYSSSGTYSAVSYVSGQTTGKWYEATFTIDSITVLGSGVSVEGTPTTTFSTTGRKTCRYLASSNNIIFKRAATACDIQISNISVREIAGNHAYQTTSASRPTLQQDSNGLYYLAFDGTDDWMATPSIDFTGTDKMTVWAGVRKLSDATRQSVVELSPIFSNPGSFAIEAPSSVAGNNVYFASTGTVIAGASAGALVSPMSIVVTGQGNISGDISRIRVNGATISTTTTNQGTGTYGNYQLYIGRRGGTTLPFNGRLYQLIVRGAASSDGQIAAGEAYVNSKTRAY